MFPRNDFYRAGEASRAVEATYGLTVTAASDRTAAKRATYAETAKAQRRGQAEPVRDTLRRSVRTAAAGATTLAEFLDRLRDDGLLVRERHSERTPGELTGYAVASPDSVDPAGKPIYYGGGKLAADLTLPKLRSRWVVAVPGEAATAGASSRSTGADSRPSAGSTPQSAAGGREGSAGEGRNQLTAPERTRIWEQATTAAARATEQIQAAAGTDPRAAADAAWAASDFLAAAGRVVEGRRGGPLTNAAGEYDRAARELWGRVPEPSSAGQGLRTAAVLLTTARFVGRTENQQQQLALLAQLAALTDAVTRLRENQDRAAQATAARRAAEQLRLTGAQRAGVPPGAPAATATRSRQPDLSSDLGRPGPGPAQGPPDTRRGPRR